MSLRRRLLLTLAPLFIAGLIGVDIATYLLLRPSLFDRVNQELLSAHPAIEASMTGGNFDDRGANGPQPSASVPAGTWAGVVSPSGVVVGVQHTFGPTGTDLSAEHPVLPSTLTPSTEQNPVFITVDGTGGVAHYQLFVDMAHGTTSDLFVTAIPLDEVTSTLSELLIIEILTTAAITLLLLLATWFVVRRGLRPLERMGTAARSAATDLSRRVEPATDTSEVGRLGLAINDMLGQLETAFAERAANEQRLRHFVSDASHELRTPLTSMRGYAELLRRNPVMSEEDVLLATRRIEEETRRMGVLVDDLLLLARLDQGRPLERGPTDLTAIVLDACADARVVDPARVVTAHVDGPVQVIGDALRLRQVLANLVRNALVHTPPGTPIEVHLGVEGDTAVIEVIDHGPGILAEHAQRIFERFHRADPGRSGDQGGSGLGLSIAAAVVAAHGGQIEVRETPGGGATFRIELPAPPQAESAPVPMAAPAAGSPRPVA
jgi:two-component system OmpR family sensor kinase